MTRRCRDGSGRRQAPGRPWLGASRPTCRGEMPPTWRAGHARVGQAGQAALLVLGMVTCAAVIAAVLAAVALGGQTSSRAQAAADLAALAAARSLERDLPGLVAGGVDRRERAAMLMRARRGAEEAAARAGGRLLAGDDGLWFVDGSRATPTTVQAAVAVGRTVTAPLAGTDGRREVDGVSRAVARAQLSLSLAGGAPGTIDLPTFAVGEGGGYDGPLSYRQGAGMRPDVAAAFDTMAAAALADGVVLSINNAYRGYAEQAELYARLGPKYAAPPGRSLHRCGTEIDFNVKGSPADGWLRAHAAAFGFAWPYSWEAWHYGYRAGPAPCAPDADGGGVSMSQAASAPPPATPTAATSTAARSTAATSNPAKRRRAGSDNLIDAAAGPDATEADHAASPEGAADGGGSLPVFVPAQYRLPVASSAARANVPAAILAALLQQESGYQACVSSPAGALGIAQFMPATAASYGLVDRCDPIASIDAAGRLLADGLRRFRGNVAFALAAYNAGAGAVERYGGVPPYAETQAYVASILALANGAAYLPAFATSQIRLVPVPAGEERAP